MKLIKGKQIDIINIPGISSVIQNRWIIPMKDTNTCIGIPVSKNLLSAEIYYFKISGRSTFASINLINNS